MKWKAFLWTNKIYCGVIWKNSKLYFLFRALCIMAVNFSQIFNLYFLKVFVDAIVEQNSLSLAIKYLMLNFFVRFLSDQLISWSRVYIKDAHLRAQQDMQQLVINRCFDFDLAIFEKTEFYDTFVRALQYATNSSEGIISTISSIISDVIGLSAVIYVLLRLNIWVVIILTILVLLDLAVNMYRDSLMDILKRRTTVINRKKNYIGSLVTKKTAFKDLKINGARDFILSKLEQVLFECNRETMNVEVRTNLYKTPVRLLETIFVIVSYFFIGKDLSIGKITIGDFNMTFNAAYSIKSYLITIGSSISSLRNSSLNASYFYEFFMYDKKNNGTMLLEEKNGLSIEFKHVFFKYPNSIEWVLNDVSFKISPGEVVLLVGENGAGKTTIINLLLGLYNPDSGEILINDVNIQNYSVDEIYRKISVVFQDHQEYAFPIAENILLRKCNEMGNFDRMHVEQLLKVIGLSGILELPEGIDTCLTGELDDNGIDLSGGERQKLAVARAFTKKSSFYILDEPSSALDPIAEDNMYNNMMELVNGSGCLIVSHHLSNSIYANRIIVLDKGRIAENGNHQSLMQLDGIYSRLYNLQRKKYIS